MPDSPLQRYTRFFEQLTAENIDQLSLVMTDDVHFVDPFNDVHDIAQVTEIFAHMFRSLESPKFTVIHAAMVADTESCALLRWELNSMLSNKPYTIVGMSEVMFAPDGRAYSHIDHWDAAQQFYERLPVIGWLLKTIRGRMSAQ